MALGAGMGRVQGIGLKFELLASSLCCIILVVLLVVVGLMGMGISKVIMGAVYLNDCMNQDMIPVYLIVSGASTVLMIGLSQFKPSAGEKHWQFLEKLNVVGIIGLLGAAFYFGWMFYGCVLVLGNFQDIVDGCQGDTTCCDSDLIKFALFTVIVDLIVCTAFVVGLFLLVFCCCLSKKPRDFSLNPSGDLH